MWFYVWLISSIKYPLAVTLTSTDKNSIKMAGLEHIPIALFVTAEGLSLDVRLHFSFSPNANNLL